FDTFDYFTYECYDKPKSISIWKVRANNSIQTQNEHVPNRCISSSTSTFNSHVTINSSSPDIPPSTPSSSSAATSSLSVSQYENQKAKNIIGSVIGGVAFLLLILLGAVLVVRRRRRRGQPHEKFRWDRMVLNVMDTNVGARAPMIEKGTGGSEGTSRSPKVDPIPSTTPLEEDFLGDEDDGSSCSTSVYSRASAGTRTLAASTISGKCAASSKIALDNPVPPISPIYLQAPSRARTDRQMQIEEKIIKSQGGLITVSGSEEEKGRTRAELEQRIEKLKSLRDSEWAYGGKGDIPVVLNG
ncbi:hypothetical protein AAF712_011905, partial [Marasmius tenuissimus]